MSSATSLCTILTEKRGETSEKSELPKTSALSLSKRLNLKMLIAKLLTVYSEYRGCSIAWGLKKKKAYRSRNKSQSISFWLNLRKM